MEKTENGIITVINIRKNDRIRAREVRVIGPNGEMLGVMPPEAALKIAKSHVLDLVEVASQCQPPSL